MPIPINEAIDRLARRQNGEKTARKQSQLQRRNTVTDTRADFKTMIRGNDNLYTGFSITKDMQYIMRYSFSLHVRPFVTTVDQDIFTEPKELSVKVAPKKNKDDKDEDLVHTIEPNPHRHRVTQGIKITEHEFANSDLRIKMNGVDLTDAILEEYGTFVDGYGYFPANEEEFDMLRIVEHLANWEKSVVLAPGRKEITISQDAQSLCMCEISYYIKYNHVDRGGLV